MKPLKLDIAVRAEAAGHLVTVNGRPALTPRGNPVRVPSVALARAIADELTATPGVLAGKGLADPTLAANFRIAAGAIDVIALADGRAEVERELLGYASTDLVCIRAAAPDALVAREAAAWDPFCDWFAGRFGVRLSLARGVFAASQPEPVIDALSDALAACDAFRLAALSLAVRASGSLVIGLSLLAGRVGPDAAFAASTLEATYQEDKWGADREAAEARAVKRLDLAQAARFVELLSEDT